VVDLRHGDRVYFYSDGLTEEFNDQNEMFGDERLLRAIADSQGLDLQEAVASLVQKVVVWRGKEHLKDDVSILAVSIS
jgi:serine phosphatase RsbU (regulator of sigma subunit)